LTAAHPSTEQDSTGQRLIGAAGEVFAEVGYAQATVREICARAGVNIAAVNYYFGNKLGLYTAVLKSTLCSAHEAMRQAVRQAPSPQEKLRTFVRFGLEHMLGRERPAWRLRLMTHELSQPTPALPSVVDEVIRPSYELLLSIVAEVVERPPQHPRTRMCAHSILGQLTHYAHGRAVIQHLWPSLKMTPRHIALLADHIVEFSLGGLKAVRTKRRRRS
jgi:AcrR family transcriptional regulator